MPVMVSMPLPVMDSHPATVVVDVHLWRICQVRVVVHADWMFIHAQQRNRPHAVETQLETIVGVVLYWTVYPVNHVVPVTLETGSAH